MQGTLADATQECLRALWAFERTLGALRASPPPAAALERLRHAQLAFAITQAAWDDLQALWEWEAAGMPAAGSELPQSPG
jgi:hypothetical protein